MEIFAGMVGSVAADSCSCWTAGDVLSTEIAKGFSDGRILEHEFLEKKCSGNQGENIFSASNKF